LIGELHGATLEVSQPSIDRAGHDVVLEANGITRHVQLKASAQGGVTTSQKIHLGLGTKPSGCVVWIHFNPDTLAIGPFHFFGGLPGHPLPDIGQFPMAKHTKGNADGIKLERPNLRVVRFSQFRSLVSIDELYDVLFGARELPSEGLFNWHCLMVFFLNEDN
jgi:hypothetical protein